MLLKLDLQLLIDVTSSKPWSTNPTLAVGSFEFVNYMVTLVGAILGDDTQHKSLTYIQGSIGVKNITISGVTNYQLTPLPQNIKHS